MKINMDSIVITPPVGIPLAGNGRADSNSKGVHDDLRANYLFMESNGKRLLFIGLDLLAFFRADADRVKEQIGKVVGLSPDEINIMATHTHSGPNMHEFFKCFLTEQDIKNCAEYTEWLVQELVKPVPALVGNAFDGKLGYGRDVVEGYSFCRRIVLKDGTFKMVFEEYDPEDIDHLACPNGNPVMSVFLLTDMKENVKGILVNYTSHPAVVCGEDWLYTRDYINALTVELQKRYGREVVVLYANGAQGNQVAADPYKPFITGWEEADKVGKGMADGAKLIADRILMDKELKREVDIRTLRREVTLPIRKVPEADVARAREMLEHLTEDVLLHGLDPRAEATSILEMAEYPKKEEDVPVQAVKIDDELIVTFPGEVFLEYGLQVIRHSPLKDTMIFGLTNDYVGYIPTREAFGQGGYEVKTSICSSKFAPEAGELLGNACCELVDDILK